MVGTTGGESGQSACPHPTHMSWSHVNLEHQEAHASFFCTGGCIGSNCGGAGGAGIDGGQCTHSEHSRFRHVQELHHGSQSSFLTCGGGGSGGGMRGHGGSDGAYEARKRAC